MPFTVAHLGAAILAVAGMVFGQNSTGGTPDIQCAKGLQMFVSRGTGEDAGPGVTGALAKRIIDRIPDSSMLPTNYPASYDDPIYFESVVNGTVTLRGTIEAYIDACPDSKIAVFGYSQGAQITTNAFCGTTYTWALSYLEPLPKKVVEKNVVAVVLFGDPTRDNAATYLKGTSKDSGNGIFRSNLKACEEISEYLVSYCDKGDVFCSAGELVNEAAHGKYIDVYGEEVLNMVVDRYKNGGGLGNGAGGNSTSPDGTDGPPSAAGSLKPLLGLVIAPALAMLVI